MVRGSNRQVLCLCALSLGGHTLLASGGGSGDQTVQIWDPTTETILLTVPAHYPVLAVDSASDILVIPGSQLLFTSSWAVAA
jgi:WD40 repeat protein